MSQLALRLLGPPRVELEGELVGIGRRKATALLAYLAVTQRSHSRDSLATLFWPDYDRSSARTGLRSMLSMLNRALGSGWLAVDYETASLSPEADVWLDVHEFQRLLRTCERHGHRAGAECPTCGQLLAQAAELYEDDFLAGFTLQDSPGFDEWQLFETEGLRDELGSVLERLARWQSAHGAHEEAVRHGRRWVALDPLHELAHRVLMEVYAQAGQRAAAVRQYRECARVLKAELGLPPSQETTALYEQIRVRDASRAKPVAAPAAVRHNLPAQPIPLVGREKELAEISDCLHDPSCRLLTLVGPGGSGKTRLSVEAAAAQLNEFEHGVFFVSLVGLQSSEGIAPTIAQAIGFPLSGQGDPEAQLLAYLARRQLQLLLDNYEHLLARTDGEEENGSRLVSAIVEAAPGVKVLVTSRAALRVQREQLYPVAGMAYPEWEAGREAEGAPDDAMAYSAMRLFAQSARRVVPDFELGRDNVTDVIRICRLVAGMPLGILLAAGWVRVLGPGQIAAQLEKGPGILETDLRGVPERQRSMRAVFDHSWGLLTDRERDVMQALSVFRRGFTRPAARAVAGSSLRELRSLVDRSLVQPTEGGRYQIHELLRQYAGEKLAQSPAASEAAHNRHAAYYAAALEEWGVDLKGRRQRGALAEMDAEIDNARAAWDWAAERGDVERLYQAAEGLGQYYERWNRHREGEAVFASAVQRLQAAGGMAVGARAETLRSLAKLLGFQAWFARELDRPQVALDLTAQGLALVERPELQGQDVRAEEAYLLWVRGYVELISGRGEARQSLQRSLGLYRAARDEWGTAAVLCELGRADIAAGDYGEAIRGLAESATIYRDLGDARGLFEATWSLANVHACEGRLEDSEQMARECLTISRELGDAAYTSWGFICLAWAFAWAGRYADSLPSAEEHVAMYQDVGVIDGDGLAHGLALVGWDEMQLGSYRKARGHLQAALSIARDTGHLVYESFCRLQLGRLAVGDGMLAEARRLFQESITGYEAAGFRDWEERARCALAYAVQGPTDLKQARDNVVQALRWAADRGSFLALAEVLPATARLLLEQDEMARAVEIYELACTLPHVGNSQWYADVVGKPIAEAAASLPPDVVAAARERGRARDMQATLEELIAEWGS